MDAQISSETQSPLTRFSLQAWLMFRLPLFRKREDHLAPLFGDLVAAARAPVAYLDYGVADDFEGRFERLTLIATLLLRRMRQLPPPAGAAAQELVDRIFAHLDDGLRRSGVGDLSVGKRMKKLAQGFYGRADAYTAALETGDELPLRAALSRNLHAGRIAPEAIASGQMQEIAGLVAALDAADLNALLAGQVLATAIAERATA
jgi:cytochrome b pre-mRNA-processing protein 3